MFEKKWQDWSSQVKGKKCRLVRNYRATGGGPEEAPKLTAIEEKILAIIGPQQLSMVCHLHQIQNLTHLTSIQGQLN
jgi:hypothetical protein